MQINVLNLDAMSVEELEAVNQDIDQPLAYRLYAKRKAYAIQARLDGHIKVAMVLDRDCDRLYEQMHPEYRW